jgi:hypothetical protein
MNIISTLSNIKKFFSYNYKSIIFLTIITLLGFIASYTYIKTIEVKNIYNFRISKLNDLQAVKIKRFIEKKRTHHSEVISTLKKNILDTSSVSLHENFIYNLKKKNIVEFIKEDDLINNFNIKKDIEDSSYLVSFETKEIEKAKEILSNILQKINSNMNKVYLESYQDIFNHEVTKIENELKLLNEIVDKVETIRKRKEKETIAFFDSYIVEIKDIDKQLIKNLELNEYDNNQVTSILQNLNNTINKKRIYKQFKKSIEGLESSIKNREILIINLLEQLEVRKNKLDNFVNKMLLPSNSPLANTLMQFNLLDYPKKKLTLEMNKKSILSIMASSPFRENINLVNYDLNSIDKIQFPSIERRNQILIATIILFFSIGIAFLFLRDSLLGFLKK